MKNKDRREVTGPPATKLQDVRRRHVFYIPGYDPMLPRRYRELYRREGAKQAEIAGYNLSIRGLQGGDTYAWHVETAIDGQQTRTTVTFLQWSDIVQTSMQRTIAGTYLLILKLVRIYIGSGTMQRLIRLRKGPVIAAFYPIVMLLLQLVLALAIASGAAFGLAKLLPLWASLGTGALIAGWLLHWFRRIDNRLFAYYLLHDYAFSAQYRGRTPPELQDRLRDFTRAIDMALQDDVDEVLVVGHSSGAHLGVTVLAEVLRRRRVAPDGPRLSFLTLGQVVQMVSFLPEADSLRADLNFLCQQKALCWVDVSAPGDGCTFALCDPVSTSGAAPESGQLWPLILSAAFTQTLSPQTLRRLKWRFFRLHFQYLCAFDHPENYDYFQVTAGPQSLGSRFQGRAPSPSSLTIPMSRYRSRETR